MGSKTKKIRAAGKFGTRSGTLTRKEYNSIEALQRRKQQSPFYAKGKVKRISAGIWKDVKTGKIFAGPAYYLETKSKNQQL